MHMNRIRGMSPPGRRMPRRTQSHHGYGGARLHNTRPLAALVEKEENNDDGADDVARRGSRAPGPRLSRSHRQDTRNIVARVERMARRSSKTKRHEIKLRHSVAANRLEQRLAKRGSELASATMAVMGAKDVHKRLTTRAIVVPAVAPVAVAEAEVVEAEVAAAAVAAAMARELEAEVAAAAAREMEAETAAEVEREAALTQQHVERDHRRQQREAEQEQTQPRWPPTSDSTAEDVEIWEL